MTTKLFRTGLWLTSGLTAAALLPTQVWAQDKPAADTGGLEEIIVTAQKREQSVQDVPIAVTAVTQETLQANRITTVNDLSAVAPGVTVKASAGGINTPAFTIRGQVSFGVVAGSDKQVSIYLDGVYLSNPRGSIFDLPDIQRLEVLRGPQGTLFGRNATAGAVSITTRDPSGEFHGKIEGSVGNFDAYRIRTTIETPQFGPFSALFSYVRNYRRGDIENAGAGTVWDRTLAGDQFAKKTLAARWLGTVDTNSYFAAVKFEPVDNFKMVYKYDRTDDHGTPEGTGFLSVDPNAPLTGALVTALLNSSPNYIYKAPDGKRPDIVNNSWVTNREQRVQGHSLTATWEASDHVTVKNVMAYRKSFVFAPSAIDGLSGLTFTPQALAPYATLVAFSNIGSPLFPTIVDVPSAIAAIPGIAGAFIPKLGQRFMLIGSEASSFAKQYSDELVVNYHSEKLNATVGALWFHSNDEAGGPAGLQNTFSLSLIPQSGVLPLGNEGRYFNKATSLAAYAQLEYKVTPQVELVLGARITHDKKTSSFRWNTLNPVTGALIPQATIVPPEYSNTKPNFLVGINWKPSPDTLIYGKWSNSFVSGGTTAGITYEPETASSFEIGFKSDYLDHRLRTNLAVFYVDYNHFQGPQSFTSPQSTAAALAYLIPLYGQATALLLKSNLSTFVLDQGKVRAKGFELEVSAAPDRGVTLGGSLSYTDVTFPFVTPNILAGFGGELVPTARPKWTASLYYSYETRPLFDDATVQFRMDGQYRSAIRNNSGPTVQPFYESLPTAVVKGYWLVNSRIALRHLKMGPVNAEIALWGKNITNRRDANFALFTSLADSANYEKARTFGVDLNVDF